MVQWYWFGIWEIGIQFSATWFFFWGGGGTVIFKLFVSGAQAGTNYGIS